jgi:hypothetical protein
MAVFSNDLFDINLMLQSDRLPAQEYLWAVSHIYRILYISFVNPEYVRYGYTEKPIREHRDFLEKYLGSLLTDFRSELRQNGSGLITFYIPSKAELQKESQSAILRKGNGLAGQFDIDLSEAMPLAVQPPGRAGQIVESYYWDSDAHMNAAGYDLAAQVLAKKIMQSLQPGHSGAGPVPADNTRQ